MVIVFETHGLLWTDLRDVRRDRVMVSKCFGTIWEIRDVLGVCFLGVWESLEVPFEVLGGALGSFRIFACCGSSLRSFGDPPRSLGKLLAKFLCRSEGSKRSSLEVVKWELWGALGGTGAGPGGYEHH